MIVAFGSIGVDLVTNVAHIPAPGETILCPTYQLIPGSKGGNQALAACRAGSRTVLVASCGTDPFATIAVSLLQGGGVDLDHLSRSDKPTGLALIAVDRQGENSIVVAAGANLTTSLSQLEAVPFGAGDTVMLQNEITEAATFGAVALGKARGARTILNVAPAAPVPAETLRDLDILIVNEHEALVVGAAVGLELTDPEGVAEAVHERFGCAAIVTLGAKGAVAFHQARRHAVAAPAVEVVDTTAAGDSFAGAFAAALDQGLSFETALRRGVAAGSLCCKTAGAQPAIPLGSEIDALLAATGD